MIVTLGDLLLDVIVRLDQPLAEGADADAVTRLGPGGQAANVAAWVAELGGRGALRRQARGRRGGRDRRRGRSSATASRSCGPVVAGRTGTVVSLVAADGEPDDGLRPRRLAGAARRRARPGLARRLRAPPPPRLLAPALADRRGGAARGRAGAAAERRPLLVERDPRLRARRASASGSRRSGPRSCSRTRTRSRSSAGRCRTARGCSSAAPLGARFGERRAARRARRGGRHDRAPATRSRPATSSAGRSSRSRRRPAASRS